MNIYKILESLCLECSPSGFESGIAESAHKILEPYCDELKIDTLGNLIGVKRCGIENAVKILLDAHLDQVGFIVSGITDDGFLQVNRIGGIDPRVLPSAEIKFLSKDNIYGVFTSVPPHLQSGNNNKAVPAESLYVDVGMTAEQAHKAVPVGSAAVFADGLCRLQGSLICGSALDDRLGFAAITDAFIKLSKKPLPVDLLILGSTLEERGCIGAKTAVFSVNPDYAIAVDVTHAKTPDSSADHSFEMGNVMIGWGPNLHRDFTGKIISKAENLSISFGLEVMEGSTGTNAWSIQTVGKGVKCGLLSIPLRYMHTPSEVASIEDAQLVSDLICAVVSDFKE